ncbi:molecular chaperone GrpE [Glaciihabitans tibetensis]|uniref:Protein GrpE n=1 Tax=Glaciihabitans tibetensis TaxID=1266600 RepID=A0A2T0VD65_9MICO|nr:nucleotide exchange factor GrpE [Glaciihabitans tibetensis]PRY68055.1 molecular chaperone GrpE [Glaciihabitans tibetensis]
MAKDKKKRNSSDEPVVPAEPQPHSEDGDTAAVDSAEDLIEAEGPDVETSNAEAPAGVTPENPEGTVPEGTVSEGSVPEGAGSDGASAKGATAEGDAPEVITLTDEEVKFIEEGEKDLVAEMRNDMLRAQAELVNFRTRVERDRVANREAVIVEVIRSMLPAIDDLARAEKHGDLTGGPLELVAQKIHSGFEKYGLRSVGEKGEPFDPHFHEALVQVPSADVKVNTIADVIETGYALGDRLIRAAKVAVLVPQD